MILIRTTPAHPSYQQTAAIRLYDKHGYRRMKENYGQYRGVFNSVCMEKTL